jgi:DNA transposition AAA+ family ATPase
VIHEPSIEAMSKAARVLIQARMLPMDQSLSAEQIEQVRKDFLDYTNKRGLFGGKLAKQIGYAASVINQWSNRRYEKGDEEAVARKINDWMERHARAERAKMPIDYVPTEVAEHMRAIADTAQSTGSMAVIVVPAGCGKTMVMKILAEKLGGRYLYCHGQHTPKEFLRELAKAVDVPPGGMTASGLIAAVVAKLKGTNRPILLDEAQCLSAKVFSVVRTIHDCAEISIVLAGTSEIMNKIDDVSLNRGQMTSRCLRYNAMDHVYDAESPDGSRKGKPLFSLKDIKALFDRAQVSIDPEAFIFAWSLACLPGRGSIRTLLKAAQLVRGRWPNQEITRDMLIWALGNMYGGVGNYMVEKADETSEALRKIA